MNRMIVGFCLDEQTDWAAELACGHRQHTRHEPPMTERPWVLTSEGRESKLGTSIDCVMCDRRKIPEGFEPYRRTPSFSEQSVPKGLLHAHSTKRGVWALILVARGHLEYLLHEPFNEQQVVTALRPGVILPEVQHHVSPMGDVDFCVEFWRAPNRVD